MFDAKRTVPKSPLHDERFEHDNCGIGACVNIKGVKSRSTVENALKIAAWLAAHPQVEAVHHPSLESEPTHALYEKYLPRGGGSIFTFEIKGDAQTAKEFIDNLPIFSLLANVADVKSLVIHPATTTHSQCTKEELEEQGIRPNTIRLSIGIEKAEDLIAALETAFEAVK